MPHRHLLTVYHQPFKVMRAERDHQVLVDLTHSLVVVEVLEELDKTDLRDQVLDTVVLVVLEFKTHLELAQMYIMPVVAVVLDTQETMEDPLAMDKVRVEQVVAVMALSLVTQLRKLMEMITVEVAEAETMVMVDLAS